MSSMWEGKKRDNREDAKGAKKKDRKDAKDAKEEQRKKEEKEREENNHKERKERREQPQRKSKEGSFLEEIRGLFGREDLQGRRERREGKKMMGRAYIIVDLGFGDAGKGSIVDYLAQTREVGAIIRYTGGPHAAHHVVRQDGTSHAFCQFGATFQPGVRSHLARNVIVKPENVLYEGRALEEKGVDNPLARLSINPRCRLVTSYHAMLCQMKEAARGDGRRGTVGIGAGEAAAEAAQFPDTALRVEDLYQLERLREKVYQHFVNMRRQGQIVLQEYAHSHGDGAVRGIYESFIRQVPVKDVLELYRRFAGQAPVTMCGDSDFIAQCGGPGVNMIFEGAHAALLDHDYGYYPYVTKTNTTTGEAERILEEANFSGERLTIGVVRALGYRHGPGPFVTEDARLSEVFEERHNKGNEWQGKVRYGWFDLLSIQHGLRLNPRVDTIALTMLDQLERVEELRVCVSYEYQGSERERLDEYFEYTIMPAGRVKVTGIKPVATRRTDELARLLFVCVPWDWVTFDDAEAFIRFLESGEGLGTPVGVVSRGPMVVDKEERGVVR